MTQAGEKEIPRIHVDLMRFANVLNFLAAGRITDFGGPYPARRPDTSLRTKRKSYIINSRGKNCTPVCFALNHR